MWRSFYGNLSLGLLNSSEKTKMRFLESSILSVVLSRWARWPFQRSYGDRLDRVQRKMIENLLRIKPAEGEPYDAFCQRRHIITGKKASKYGRWSERWARSINDWAAHVERNHDNKGWSHFILGWRGGFWLEMQRFFQSRGNESRTRTRSVRAKAQRRWEEGVTEARAILRQ